MNIVLIIGCAFLFIGLLLLGESFAQAEGTSKRFKDVHPQRVAQMAVGIILIALIILVPGVAIQFLKSL